VPVGPGVAAAGTGVLLLLEALAQRSCSRSSEDCRAIGAALAALHQVHGEQFGLTQFDGFVSTRGGAVLIDPCPYFGHPEVTWRCSATFSRFRLTSWLRTATSRRSTPATRAGANSGGSSATWQ
jgi:fructosamine-3-kinase